MFRPSGARRHRRSRARPCSSQAPACSRQVSHFASSGRHRAELGIASAGGGHDRSQCHAQSSRRLVPTRTRRGRCWAYFGIAVAIVAAVSASPPLCRVPRLATWRLPFWALAACSASELTLIRDEQWFAVAVAITASSGTAALASRLNEQRLRARGCGLARCRRPVSPLGAAQPRDPGRQPQPRPKAHGGCCSGWGGAALTAPHSRRWILGAAAVLDLYAVTLITLELAVRVWVARTSSVVTRAVGAVWALSRARAARGGRGAALAGAPVCRGSRCSASRWRRSSSTSPS